MTDEMVPEATSLGHLLAVSFPPLDWTLAKLTGVWAADGEMISCPLPGHDDSTPSFNMWSPDANGVPTRFGCFGCGRKGRVLDLIEIVEGLDGAELLARADELATEAAADTYERPESQRRQVELRDLTETYDALVNGMTQRDFQAFTTFMSGKGFHGEDIQTWVADEFGWVATASRAIAIPHKTPEGVVCGIKYRVDDRKWNEPGSRFPHLYGAWRNKGHDAMLICEGESDTAWAAYALRNEAIDVFGLPSGASQDITAEQLELCANRKVVFIAFDADDAGVTAARRWSAALPVRVVRLPDGEDVLSCGIPVLDLLRASRVPTPLVSNVQVRDGIYVKVTMKQDAEIVTPLSDFTFRPIRELRNGDGEAPVWEGYVTGQTETDIIRSSDFTSAAFTRWANDRGKSWMGAGSQSQHVMNLVTVDSNFLPLERYDTKAGKRGRSYVGPDFCIGPDRIRYIEPALGNAHLASKIKIVQGTYDKMALFALENLNDPAVMATVLGWLCATLVRGERAPAPPLFVSGESGSGKTHLVGTVLSSFGFHTETNLTTTTPFGVDCLVSSCVGFPVWFDEYRGGARVDSMERLRQLLRDAYNGQPSMKGGMTQQVTELTEVSTWAGIIVSGEMSSYETSIRDRLIMLDLDKEDRNADSYAFLRDNPARTEGLGYALLRFLVERQDSLFRVQPVGPKDLPDRFRNTLGFVQTGWDAWCAFRTANGFRDAPATGPNFDVLAKERSATEDPWLDALRTCLGVPIRSGPGDVADVYGGRGAAYIVEQTEEGVLLVPSEVIVEAKRAGIELPARANELVQWLKRRYEVRDTRVGTRRGKLAVGLRL